MLIFLAGILLCSPRCGKEDLAIIAANSVTAVLIGLILSIKAKHG